MSYYRGYDDYDRGYGGGGGGYGDAFRGRYDDFRERDYGGRPDRDRQGGGRRDSGGFDRRSGGYDGGRRDEYDRRRDEYGRRREGYGGGGGGGGGGRRDGGKSGWGGGGGGGGRGDRKGGFRGRGRGGRENGGRGRGNKRSFGGRDRGGSDKRPRLDKDKIDNWGKGDRHSIMESHFMETVPHNFQEEWQCVVLPAGKRSLVVAANNMSQLYTKDGQPDLKFKSSLPNGSLAQSEVMKYHDLTILDSVYCPEKKQIYILDLLHWKHFPYYDTEAEFRAFFLTQQFSSLKDPKEVSVNNEITFIAHGNSISAPVSSYRSYKENLSTVHELCSASEDPNYPLIVLEKFPCTVSGIEQALKQVDYKVEGLLFVDKKSTYECSDSPNSLLLRLDQLDKLLGVTVPEGISFTETGPSDEKWREELEERKKLKAAREQAAKEAKESEKEKEKEAESQQEADASAGGDEATGEEYATGGEYAGGEYTSGNEYAAEGEYTTGTGGEYTSGGEYTASAEYATEGEYTAGGEYTSGGGEYAATTTEESYPTTGGGEGGGEYSAGENYSEGWSTGGDSNAYSTSNYYG